MAKEDQRDGHTQLVDDLCKLQSDFNALVAEAEAFEFDDFKTRKYDAPKVELDRRLRTLARIAEAVAQRVRGGEYDQ